MRSTPGHMTARPILPDLLDIVQLFPEGIHYRDAADLLAIGGQWGTELPPTPAATVAAYLTTRRDHTGELLFQRISRGTYAVRSQVRANLERELIGCKACDGFGAVLDAGPFDYATACKICT